MRDFFHGDALNQIQIGLAVSSKIKALKQVLHHRAHLSELTAQPFLQGVGSGRIRFIGDDGID